MQIKIHQPRGVKRKITERNLRSGVNWTGALKQRGVKQVGIKQGMSIYEGIKHQT